MRFWRLLAVFLLVLGSVTRSQLRITAEALRFAKMVDIAPVPFFLAKCFAVQTTFRLTHQAVILGDAVLGTPPPCMGVDGLGDRTACGRCRSATLGCIFVVAAEKEDPGHQNKHGNRATHGNSIPVREGRYL